MRPLYYRLEGRTPVPEPDRDAASGLLGRVADRRVARDTIDVYGQAVVVSTVFLVIDHAWAGRPRLFETMVFWPGAPLDEWQRRYATWDDALAGHRVAVAAVEAAWWRRRRNGTRRPHSHRRFVPDPVLDARARWELATRP